MNTEMHISILSNAVAITSHIDDLVNYTWAFQENNTF